MIAADGVVYDLLFVVHVLAAVATVVVLVSLRVAAGSVRDTSDRATLRQRFPDRVDRAARVVHLLPVTGLAMSGLGGSDVSLARPWVAAGLVLYLLEAAFIEARVLPAEHELARAIQAEGPVDLSLAVTLARRLDAAVLLLTVILVLMIGQF